MSLKTIVKGLLVAVAGQTLVEASVLSSAVGYAKKALLATIISGMLIASFIICGCYGLFYLMTSYGADAGLAIGMALLVLFLITAIATLLASHYSSQLQELPQNNKTPDDRCADLEELMAAFLDGIKGTPPPRAEPTAPPRPPHYDPTNVG